MNVFKLRNYLVNEYKAYISSFVHIKDDRIRQYVHQAVEEGLLWPNPIIQLNLSFKQGASIDDLIAEGILDPQCSQIFRLKKNNDNFEESMGLLRHQEQAIHFRVRKHLVGDCYYPEEKWQRQIYMKHW